MKYYHIHLKHITSYLNSNYYLMVKSNIYIYINPIYKTIIIYLKFAITPSNISSNNDINVIISFKFWYSIIK